MNHTFMTFMTFFLLINSLNKLYFKIQEKLFFPVRSLHKSNVECIPFVTAGRTKFYDTNSNQSETKFYLDK